MSYSKPLRNGGVSDDAGDSVNRTPPVQNSSFRGSFPHFDGDGQNGAAGRAFSEGRHLIWGPGAGSAGGFAITRRQSFSSGLPGRRHGAGANGGSGAHGLPPMFAVGGGAGGGGSNDRRRYNGVPGGQLMAQSRVGEQRPRDYPSPSERYHCHGKQGDTESNLSPNLKDLIAVDIMLDDIEHGWLPQVPDGYRSKILGLSRMPSSVAPLHLDIDPAVGAMIFKAEPEKDVFDARVHIIAYGDLIRGGHSRIVERPPKLTGLEPLNARFRC